MADARYVTGILGMQMAACGGDDWTQNNLVTANSICMPWIASNVTNGIILAIRITIWTGISLWRAAKLHSLNSCLYVLCKWRLAEVTIGPKHIS